MVTRAGVTNQTENVLRQDNVSKEIPKERNTTRISTRMAIKIPWSKMTREERSGAITALVENIPVALRKAVAETTNRRHASLCLQILEITREKQISTIEAIVILVSEHKGKASTRQTLLGSLIGAVRNARLMKVPLSIVENMTQHPTMKRLVRVTNKAAFAEAGTVAIYPAKPEEVWGAIHALDKMPSTQLSRLTTLYLVLWWTLATRSGDALELLGENVVVEQTSLRARFVTGKVVATCGPVTTHTVPLRKDLEKMIPKSGPIFPENLRKAVQELAMRMLKEQNPQIEMRSIRRGALTTMAMNGASDPQLMHFSHHTTESMLYRYLGWGMFSSRATLEGAQVAQALLPSNGSE